MNGLNFLSAIRINSIMQILQDQRELPKKLLWLSRIPIVGALDNEIMARFLGYVQIADIVADDAEAVTYTSGRMQFESYAVPNIKHGATMTQSQIQQLYQLQQSGSLKADGGLFLNWEQRTLDSLLLGIRQRLEALCIAMLLDGFSYDRLGIKLVNIKWGMPADLNVTPAVAWTDTVNADPVNDMWTLNRTAQVRYGAFFSRATTSTAAFLQMLQCVKFQNQVRMFLAPNVSYINLNLADTASMQALASRVLGIEIELYDQRFWSVAADGSRTSAPFMAINKVVLTDPSNDNSPMVWDIANGVPAESIVAGLLPSGEFGGGLNAGARGPVAYVTGNQHLNPPDITYWAVMRAFPRKHMFQANGVLTVGNIVEVIPVGEPVIP